MDLVAPNPPPVVRPAATMTSVIADQTHRRGGGDGGPAAHLDGERAVRAPWVPVGTASRAHPDSATVRPRRVFTQVIVAALAVLIGVGLVGVVASRRLAEAEAVNDAARITDLFADAVVQPALTEPLVSGDAAALRAMDQAVRPHVGSWRLIRVKIWSQQGRILYSDASALIGQSYPLAEDDLEVLKVPRTVAEVSDLHRPENRLERGQGKLLEVYRPVWTPSGRPLLLETYASYSSVTARTEQLWKGFAGVTLTSLLMLVVLLLPVLWRLLDRLKQAQGQREAMLVHAVDASVEERRRIAGALHDGVVQDLAAASFTISGAAQRASAQGQVGLAQDLRGAGTSVRTSIGGLRSLLVDIYPPSLATAGLEAALTDLAASLRARDITVDLVLAPALSLEPDEERLVFRVAQECLNNVVRHARATNVHVVLQQNDDEVILQITDDGAGFDAAHVLSHPREGHFGLRVLSDVAGGAGADLELSSTLGAGTGWRLRIPRS
jgi:two-component system, NarL family, sensor kinase